MSGASAVRGRPPLAEADLDHVLQHTREDWNTIRGERMFITGGTGFFGIWLLESFCHANARLGLDAKAVVLTRDPARFAARAPHLADRAELEFVRGDVRDFTFPPGRFACVVHAATEASAKLNDEAPEEMLDAIVGGTRRVLAFAAQAGARQLLLTSSGAVYGRQPGDLTHINEDYPGGPDPLSPTSAYAEGKRLAEHLSVLAGRRHGFEVKIARCFAFVGPHLPLDAHFAIGNFIRDALDARPLTILGDGTPHRSYLYAADLAVWLWRILFRAPGQRAFNVGSAAGLSLHEVARIVAETLHPGLPVEVKQTPVPGQTPSRYVPDVRRAWDELRLREQIDLRDAIARTGAWWRSAEPEPR